MSAFFPSDRISSLITVDNNIAYKNIVPTDYFCYGLKYFGILDFNSVQECVGKNIEYNGATLTISDIYETQFYERFMKNDNIYGSYGDLIRSIYGNCFMSDKTYFYLNCTDVVLISDKTCYINNIPVTISYDSSLSNNDIIISRDVFDAIIVEPNLSMNYIGTSINVPLTYDISSFNAECIINDIIDNSSYSSYYKIYVSNQMMEEIFVNLNGLKEYESSGIYLSDFSSEDIKSIFKYVDDNNFISYYEYSTETAQIFDFIVNLRHFFVGVLVVLLVLVGLLIMFFIQNLIKLNKRSIGILRIQGMSEGRTLFVILYENVKLVSYGFLISIVPYIFSIKWFNNIIKKEWQFNYDVTSISFWVLFFGFAGIIILTALASIIPSIRFSRKDIYSLIY